MLKLKTEYTDVKDKKHKVEHLVVSDENKKERDQVVEELLLALTRPVKRIPA